MELNHTQVSACFAALQGNGLALDICKEWAQSEGFEQHVDATREMMARANDLSADTKLSRMQALKIKGASTLVVYVTGLRKMIARDDVYAIQNAKMQDLANYGKRDYLPSWAGKAERAKHAEKFPKGEAQSAKTEDKAQAPTFTVSEIIALLQSAHAAGMLTADNYNALSAIRPVSQPLQLVG